MIDQNTYNFLKVVAEAVNLAQKGHLTEAQKLLPQIKEWIKVNAPNVPI